MKDLAIILVSRDRPDLVSKRLAEYAKTSQEHDLYLVEMGTHPRNMHADSILAYSSDVFPKKCEVLFYTDEEFSGKAFGHNLGLQFARQKQDYRYYWITMNDVVFKSDLDHIHMLVQLMNENPRLAILSPTAKNAHFPGSQIELGKSNKNVRPVCAVDYLSFLIRASVVDIAGFLNPEFKYSWGAIAELAYNIYSGVLGHNGYYIGYTDLVSYEHLGGTTYTGDRTILRDEYTKRAKAFAREYFTSHYGEDWDQLFWQAAKRRQPDIVHNTYSWMKRAWEK